MQEMKEEILPELESTMEIEIITNSSVEEHTGLTTDQHSYMDQFSMPRPSYYMLRILGVWQPKNCSLAWMSYGAFTYFIFITSSFSILGFEYVLHGIQPKRWKTGSIINSCFTLFNLTCPFIFIKYYFKNGSYDQLIGSVFQSSYEHRGRVRFLSRMYTLFSVTAWMLGATFFYLHWLPFFNMFWQHILYAFTVFYCTGWWATWLSIYGFVCHVHSLQAKIFCEIMQEKFQRSTRSRDDERKRIGVLLGIFNEFNRWLERTQSDFGKIVSFAMAYHTIDIVVFSLAFWDQDFGKGYSLGQYIGGVTFDLSSIAIKLYPAAVVSAAVSYITRRAGSECYPHHTLVDMPLERFQFYEHLSIREQIIGLRILGVKISVRIAVGILVTLVTGLATFLRFVIANSGNSLF